MVAQGVIHRAAHAHGAASIVSGYFLSGGAGIGDLVDGADVDRGSVINGGLHHLSVAIVDEAGGQVRGGDGSGSG